MVTRLFFLCGWWLATSLLLVTGCNAGDEHPVDVQSVALPASAEAAGVGPGEAGRSRDDEAANMPAGLRRAWITARMARAGAAYRVRKKDEEAGWLVAVHPMQDMRYEFGPRGVRVGPRWPASNDRHLELSLVGVGYQGRIQQVRAARPVAHGNRVEYRRGQVVEWYLHGPLGLEQGFTVNRRPIRAGPAEPLVVELELRGRLKPSLVRGGKTVVLRSDDGRARMRYSNLLAQDAHGRPLAASLSLRGQRLRLRVEDHGAVYPVEIDPLIEEAKLTASDGAPDAWFGWSVSLDGNRALIGAFEDDEMGMNAGAAYVFVRDATGWAEEAKLTASDAAPTDYFGWSVSLNGDHALVGAPEDNHVAVWCGSAYVFVRDATGWTEEAKLTASDAAAADDFGRSVSLDSTRALIGAPQDDDMGMNSGSAYVFVHDATGWAEEDKLTALDGDEFDQFGWSVSLDGSRALVGANADDDWGDLTGSAYVFVGGAGGWTQEAKLLASDASWESLFGHSVSLSGNRALVGAYWNDTLGTNSGAAYVFLRGAGGWTEETKLIASDGAADDLFGQSVFLDGDRALIGAPGDDDMGSSSGSAYVFVRSAGGWTEQAKVTASDGALDNRFGFSVSLGGDRALIGAPWDEDLGSESGSAYVFQLIATDGTPCPGPFACQSGFCVDGVCCNSDCGAGATEDCQACSMAEGATAEGVCTVLQATTECRGAVGLCDLPEYCTGTSVVCPIDAIAQPSTECRGSAAFCDTAEVCDGNSPYCPPDDSTAMDGQNCDDLLDWTIDDVCLAGICSGTEAGSCDHPVPIEVLPYTHSSVTTGRPSHIDTYGAGCSIPSQYGSPDVVYELHALAGEAFSIVVQGAAGFDAAVAVLRVCADWTDCLAWGDEAGPGQPEEVTFTAPEDGTYLIVAEGSNSDGPYTLTIERTAAPDGNGDGGRGGCSCRVAAAGDSSPSPSALFLLGVVTCLIGSRRRRKRPNQVA